MRRSPFIEVRFISPDVAAGSQMWLACPIWVGMMSTSTENSPPLRTASMIAATIAGTVAPRHGGHGVLHQVGPLLVGLLELQGVQRRLVVVAAPDVVHAALAVDQELVDVGRGPADMRVGRPGIALLVPAEADAAAAGTADVARGERHVHQRAVGAVVVVAPDQALLVGEHGAAARAAFLRLGDPFRRLADLVDGAAR